MVKLESENSEYERARRLLTKTLLMLHYLHLSSVTLFLRVSITRSHLVNPLLKVHGAIDDFGCLRSDCVEKKII
ncbi:hypothetical protein PUN28_014005 [Cardiocondyla obscurior]|uniref:Uncharacterized protein n=1 Tax=Cardiocondyla obscurior TaxID=286306 RepID=A0AAW2F975_9HYME